MAQPHTINFLALPGEIRNKIYDFTFGGDVYRLKAPSNGLSFAQVRPRPLDLLLVCRQIYEEGRFVPFTSNVFSFGIHDARLTHLTAAQISSIRNIRIETFRFVPMLSWLRTTMGEVEKMEFPTFALGLHGVRTIEILGVAPPSVPEDCAVFVAEFYEAWYKLEKRRNCDRKAFLETMFRVRWPEAKITFRWVEYLVQVM